MYVTGRCTVYNFPSTIAEIVTRTNPSTNLPYFSMVSSKVGNLLTDDGYVFQSNGVDGNSKVIWGLPNGDNILYSSVNLEPYITAQYFVTENDLGERLCAGFTYFVASDYTAGSTGSNGTFVNKLYTPCGMAGTRIDSNAFSNGKYNVTMTDNNFSIRNIYVNYHISVTEDRVIIATYYNDDAVNNIYDCLSGVMYIGKIDEFNEQRKSTFMLSSSMRNGDVGVDNTTTTTKATYANSTYRIISPHGIDGDNILQGNFSYYRPKTVWNYRIDAVRKKVLFSPLLIQGHADYYTTSATNPFRGKCKDVLVSYVGNDYNFTASDMNYFGYGRRVQEFTVGNDQYVGFLTSYLKFSTRSAGTGSISRYAYSSFNDWNNTAQNVLVAFKKI